MGHRIPIRRDASLDERVAHRQHMINMSKNGNGFRPNYMEAVLVNSGQVDPSFVQPERSKRSIEKAKAKRAFRERFERERQQFIFSP